MRTLRSLASSTLRRAGYEILKPGDLERLIAERSGLTRNRRDFLVSHPPVKGSPSIELIDLPALDTPERERSAQRLLDAYRLAASQEGRTPIARVEEDLWTNLVRNELGELLEILASNDVRALAAYLLHFGEKYSWFGGLTFSLDGYETSRDRSRTACIYYDKLLCLAEAIGVLPLEHPEHGRWGENLCADIDHVLESVERELGIAIEPPVGAVHITGVRTGRGVFHYRHLSAIYTAHRLSALSAKGGRVCEYGGGLGTVALYARRFGLKDYTLFDIPLTNLFAGHFLIHAIGPNAVTLFGEEPAPQTIRVLPYWECTQVPAKSFELTLNQDSFPEIDKELVTGFLGEIRRTTRSWFLSINHEAESEMTKVRRQLNLSGMLKGQLGFERRYRMKYWMREGYVEELYALRA